VAARPRLIRLAVFGRPVAHSLSPLIHRQFARQFRLQVDYRAVEAGPDEFPQKLAELIREGGRGCNVTVPLKHQAWQIASRSSPEANQAQAANTLVFGDPDDCFADNTDGRGLVRDLSGCWSRPASGFRILIIGAGGAAAGIMADLLRQGPIELVLGNRNPERARTLAERFAAIGNVRSCALDGLSAHGPFDLVVNATSLGHSGLSPDLPATLFSPGGLCYDLNYGQAAAPLSKQCESRGIRYQDGLGMLVEQAALSFALWTGKLPDSAPVVRRLRGNPL